MDIRKINEKDKYIAYEAFDSSKKSENQLIIIFKKNIIGSIYKIVASIYYEEIECIDSIFEYSAHKFGKLIYHYEDNNFKKYLCLPKKDKYYYSPIYDNGGYSFTSVHDNELLSKIKQDNCGCSNDKKDDYIYYDMEEIIKMILNDLGEDKYEIIYK